MNEMKSRFFWYAMIKDIITYVSECDQCQKLKTGNFSQNFCYKIF